MEDLRRGVAARQEEAQRLRKDQDATEARVESLLEATRERGRAWAGLEEARSQEAKRLIEVQTVHAELRKVVGALQGRADNLEGANRRLAPPAEKVGGAQGELGGGQ